MPPEPLPWDRKDYVLKDNRKHERGDALGGGVGSSSAPRWRDPYHAPRDLVRASPRRPFSGHYRQGGGYNQIHPEDSVSHGCTPSRCDRFWFEDDGFRPSSVRYGGGGGRSRESRGSFRRSPYWDPGDFSRQHHHDPHVTAQRSVAAPVSSVSQTPLKDQNGKTTGSGNDGFDTDRRFDHRGHSLGIPWKTWSRPGGLALTKTGRSDFDEAGLEMGLPSGKQNPIQSSVISSLPQDEDAPRKKPRLGWGQGLAKYEKQKVGGSVDTSFGGCKGALSDNSQKNTGISGCLSPSTPCSATCSSSPGTESKAVNDDNAMSQNIYVPGSKFLQSCEEISNNLDNLEVNPIGSLDTLLADLFQSEDAFSGDSTLTRHSAINELLKLKENISNGLEKIECEIDFLEKELKSRDCDAKIGAIQSFFKLSENSASECCVQPLVGVPDESNHLKDQEEASTEVAFVENCAPCTRLVEHVVLVEDNDINHVEIVSSTSSKSSDFAMKLCDTGIEKLAGSVLSVYNDRSEITEQQQQIVDSESRVPQIVASEDGNRNSVYGGCSSVYLSSDGIMQGKTYYNLITSIVYSNRNAAKQASKVFDAALSTNFPCSDIWGLFDLATCRKNDLKIKEKLAAHKVRLKFKERVLTLKFRALHHLWKEDLHLLSMRKLRTKSSKQFELSNRSLQNGSQKQRFSIRSRFTLPAGNLTLVPTTEIVDFTSKLLSDSQFRLYRNNLKMPALLLDDKERRCIRFVTQNGLIEDPPMFEKERAMINPWSGDEKEVFMEKLAQYGKDFTKISSFLNHKTTADCIEFYYKHHKSESFKEVKKQLYLRKQQRCLPANTYLVPSGKMWNHEANAAALDMLGAASDVVAHNHGTARSQKYTGRTAYGTYNDMKVLYGSSGYLDKTNSVDISGQERRSASADMLAGICGALYSEAMSSSITSSVDPSEKMNCITMDRLLTPEVSENLDEDACSDEDCVELDPADWTDEEKSIFMEALSMHGKDFAKISTCMRTRTREQCKIFFSKARKCLGLDTFQHGAVNGGMQSSDANGGRSDMDDAGVAEMDSAICSTQSCSKTGVDVTQSVANTSCEGIPHAASTHCHAEADRSNEQDEDVLAGPNLEVSEVNVDDKHVSVFDDGMLPSEGDDLQSDVPPKERFVDALGCTEAVQLSEFAGPADQETKVVGIRNILSPIESVVKAVVEVESKPTKQLTASRVWNADTGGCSPADDLKKEIDTKASLVTEVGLSNETLTNIDFTANGSGPLCSEPDLNASVAALLQGNKANACHNLTFVPGYQRPVHPDLHPCLPKKPQSILIKQENAYSVPLNSYLPDPSSICFGGSLSESSHTTLNFEEHANKRHQKMVKRDLYRQYMLRNVPVNRVDQNIHILRGYPLQILNQELKREADLSVGEKSSLLETDTKKTRITLSNQSFMSDMEWNKNNLSNLSHSMSGLLCPSKSENHSEAEIRPCVKNACSETEEYRTGDVKLFGKILSHPFSLQKSNSSSHEGSVRHPSPKLDVCSTLSCNSNGKDGNRFISNAESSGQVGLEEVPVRTYGFWDGKRIQTGLSSLPDTAAMLAKYPGSLAGVPFCSAKDGIPSRNGLLTDYQRSYIPHLSSDGKRLESFSELQKMNGIEMVSGLHQQGRLASLGPNMMGGRILVGGGGVSDPVAALKIHYAARAKVLSGDMESWRGDIGGR